MHLHQKSPFIEILLYIHLLLFKQYQLICKYEVRYFVLEPVSVGYIYTVCRLCSLMFHSIYAMYAYTYTILIIFLLQM